MLYDAEKRLLELLLREADILIDKTQREVSEVIISTYDGNLEEKGDELYKNIVIINNYLKKGGKESWKSLKKLILHKTLEHLYQRPKYYL